MGDDASPRAASAASLADLLRGLLAADTDARDEATEELGRRLRGAERARITRYLQTVGREAADPDARERIKRLLRLPQTLDKTSELEEQAAGLLNRSRRLHARLDAWERYRDDATPGTPAGAWVIENLDAIDLHIGSLSARISEAEDERERLKSEIAGAAESLDELPGTANE